MEVCRIPEEGCDYIANEVKLAMKKHPFLAIPLKDSNSGSSHVMWKVELQGGSHPSSS